MTTKLKIPDVLPDISFPDNFRAIAKAVAIAGIWADSCFEKSLKDAAFRDIMEKSVRSKGSADITTFLDALSENIMAKVMITEGKYRGGIFGEEGLVINPNHELTLVLDGLDGTEAARSRPSGIESPYGPSAGIFFDKDGVISPIEGAVYLPRQNKGYFGSVESGKVFEYRVEPKKGDCKKIAYEVAGVRELQAFDSERTDIKYILSFFLEKNEEFPGWVANLYMNANHSGHQNILHSAGAQADQLARLVSECGERRFHLGPSAAVAAKGTKLHDIMGLAPAVIALGGTVGNLNGAVLGRDMEFIPEEHREEYKPLAMLKENCLIPHISIGPVISAHNEKIYQTVRRFMLENAR